MSIPVGEYLRKIPHAATSRLFCSRGFMNATECAAAPEPVWRVSQLPALADGKVRLRLCADSPLARELLGDVDVWGHQPFSVEGRVRTSQRCPQTGAFYTTELVLVLSR